VSEGSELGGGESVEPGLKDFDQVGGLVFGFAGRVEMRGVGEVGEEESDEGGEGGVEAAELFDFGDKGVGSKGCLGKEGRRRER
jgi:hypothetical protein